MAKPTPTQEELDDILLSARFGEVDEIKAFGEQYGWDALAGARDERGNSALHMACGNGHLGE
jgi:ankyrin repeat protein